MISKEERRLFLVEMPNRKERYTVMVTQEEETQASMSQSDILSVLDNEGIAPKRFLPDDEGENNIEEETQKDFSANFTALKKQSQQ